MSMNEIYLAGPFFKPEQVATIAKLETLLRSMGSTVYSPREDGVLQAMTLAERKQNARKIFINNVTAIRDATFIVAVIDGFDPGTIWEMGYAYGIEKDIISYTDHDYGLNVMLQECVDAHVKSEAQLKDCLSTLDYELFRNFNHGAVT